MLQHGDWITIADTTLVFSEDADPEERPPLEIDSIDPAELLTSKIHSSAKFTHLKNSFTSKIHSLQKFIHFQN